MSSSFPCWCCLIWCNLLYHIKQSLSLLIWCTLINTPLPKLLFQIGPECCCFTLAPTGCPVFNKKVGFRKLFQRFVYRLRLFSFFGSIWVFDKNFLSCALTSKCYCCFPEIYISNSSYDETYKKVCGHLRRDWLPPRLDNAFWRRGQHSWTI